MQIYGTAASGIFRYWRMEAKTETKTMITFRCKKCGRSWSWLSQEDAIAYFELSRYRCSSCGNSAGQELPIPAAIGARGSQQAEPSSRSTASPAR